MSPLMAQKTKAASPVDAYLEIFKKEYEAHRGSIRDFFNGVSLNKLRPDELDYIMSLARDEKAQEIPELKFDKQSIVFVGASKPLVLNLAKAAQGKFTLNNYELNFANRSTLQDKVKYVNGVIKKELGESDSAQNLFHLIVPEAQAVAPLIWFAGVAIVTAAGAVYAMATKDLADDVWNQVTKTVGVSDTKMTCQRDDLRKKESKFSFTVKRVVNLAGSSTSSPVFENVTYSGKFGDEGDTNTLHFDKSVQFEKISSESYLKNDEAMIKDANKKFETKSYTGSSPSANFPDEIKLESSGIKKGNADYDMFAALYECCVSDSKCGTSYNQKAKGFIKAPGSSANSPAGTISVQDE